ncbi:MAG TPA: PAS domain-containing protein, partial [Candidatus Paenibacillus intestinavium]|nr:PAS domain-containing protein [Candidatus Paenibacillus intestinavium]
MSIRSKLSLSISLIVLLILVLNVVFSQINAIRVQENTVELQVATVAKQLAITIKLIESTNRNIEHELAMRLKASAQTVEEILDPDIANVTTEQLEALKLRLDLDDITLWVMQEDELVSVLSSNPHEVNLRSKSWDYWDIALKEVMNLRPVTVEQGERSTNFYAGPINFAVTDPSKINKWGYYYTGKTNYMINTALNTDRAFSDGYIDGNDRIIFQLLAENDALLEITAFNPTFFGKEKIIKLKQGKPVYNLDVRDISFGSYHYKNLESDIESVHRALQENRNVTTEFYVDETSLTRTFIPIEDHQPYVIGIVIDKHILMEDTHKQFVDHIIIAVILLLVTIVGSYFIAELLTSPLTKIMYKVNAISMNQFHTSLVHTSSDEFGLLASQVNTMGNNLSRYTNELKQTNIELRNTKQYLESFFKHTTDAVHIVDFNYKIMQVNDAFECMFEWDSVELVGEPLSNFSTKDQASYEQLIEQVIRGHAITS